MIAFKPDLTTITTTPFFQTSFSFSMTKLVSRKVFFLIQVNLKYSERFTCLPVEYTGSNRPDIARFIKTSADLEGQDNYINLGLINLATSNCCCEI